MTTRLVIARFIRPGIERAWQAVPESLRRDWHQFRLLSRDALRQLIDTALFSRDADPMEYALWLLALVATPPAFFASRQLLLYTSLVNAPPEVVEAIALAHRMFFVIYGMLAAALLAALTWESLFPDGRDQEIIGVLPVRPYTFAGAKLGAAIVLGVGFTAAVNAPAALIYSAVSFGHPLLPNLFVLIAGQMMGTMLASLAVYFALLTTRGLAAVILGAGAGAWLGAALQLVTVVLLVEVFFFLPGVLDNLVRSVLDGNPLGAAFPPVWFVSVNEWIAGSDRLIVANNAPLGVAAITVTALAVGPVYLLPARWLGRRALESRSRERAVSIISLFKAVARMTAASPPVRGIFVFATASLLRSRRHLLVLATYFGLAIATCVASVILLEVRGFSKLNVPGSWLLALPLVFIFFLALGLRSSFRLPTEVDANWPFKLSQPSLGACVNATALVMFSLAVLPVAIVLFVGTASIWPLGDAIKATLLQLLAGVVLIECLLLHWTKIPFACGHAPSPDVLKAWWPLYLFTLYMYAFKQSDWQFAALRSPRVLTMYVASGLVVIVVVRLLRHRKIRGRALEFDVVPSHSVERLNLSEALN